VSAVAVAVASNRYTCTSCAHELQVFGRGRHRLYFELGDAGLRDPMMDGVCPQCGTPLPGKHVSASS
jgi:hypothetical protein